MFDRGLARWMCRVEDERNWGYLNYYLAHFPLEAAVCS